jgi:hypothetical protein
VVRAGSFRISDVLFASQPEDPPAYLSHSHTKEFSKRQMIYGPPHPSIGIDLVVNGKVHISQIAEDGREVSIENLLIRRVNSPLRRLT